MKLPSASTLTTLVLTTVGALGAAAEEVTLKASIQGATLHEGGISMSVYYLDNNNTFEVVLTYDVDSGPYQPERIRVNLDNGEEARLSLPHQPQVVYALSREDEMLRVEAMPFVQGFASAAR